MIVRIATEDQYEVPQEHYEELNRLDNEVVEAVQAHDEERYTRIFGQLIEMIRSRGERLGADDLRRSEIIVPPPDTDLAEAERHFSGEGIIPEALMPGSS